MAKSVIENSTRSPLSWKKALPPSLTILLSLKKAWLRKPSLPSSASKPKRNFRSIRIELTAISKRLDMLEQQFSNLRGVTKEIDEIRDRVRDIEKRLSLAKKIAA